MSHYDKYLVPGFFLAVIGFYCTAAAVIMTTIGSDFDYLHAFGIASVAVMLLGFDRILEALSLMHQEAKLEGGKAPAYMYR